MNRNVKHLLIGIASALLATGALMAQATPTQKREAHATRRDIHQEKRIEQGEKSGQLTPREAGRLERQTGRIDKAQAKAGADGHVSKKEAARINHMQNRESRRIYRQKHDAQTRK